LIFTEYRANIWMIITAHLTSFFVIAMACHGRLALLRPEPSKLTAYYFYMALGGVMGGVFNTLIAPEIFTRIAEYPVVVVLAVWLVYLTRPEVRAAAHPMRFQWAAVAAVFGAALMYA